MAKIFISYAREDQARVEVLYRQLQDAGYQPWLDREHLIPGQKWGAAIKTALKQSDFVLVCLSATSINKRGFLQTEIKQALEHAQQKLDDDVWLIPARLDDCEVPEALSDIQWVDLFEQDGFDDLLRALMYQLSRLGRSVPNAPGSIAATTSLTPASSFLTVKVDETGTIVEKKQGTATCLLENLTADLAIEMVALKGGEFWMGSTEWEAKASFGEAKRWYEDSKEDWYTRESPRHRVSLSPFWIGKYPVTQSQWYEVMGDLPEMEEAFRGENRPIINVIWSDAVAFCKELTRRTGHVYRLPTEAEWEYACRAGTTTPFAFGPTISPEIVNYHGNYPYGKTSKGKYRQTSTDVGSLGVANGYGLFDMHGNVWEWCSDWFSAKYYEECRTQGVVIDPQGPKAGSDRVFRGGSWDGNAVVCRSAARNSWTPGFRDDDLGFRLVRAGR